MKYIIEQRGPFNNIYSLEIIDSIFGFQRKKKTWVCSVENPDHFRYFETGESKRKAEKIVEILKGE